MAVSGGSVLKGIVVAAGIVVILLGVLWLGQRRLIYLPDTSSVPPAADAVSGARDVTLTTEDGLELGAWYVPARSQDEDTDTRGTVTVLVANGNGGNRQSRASLAEALADAGLATLLFDYRGYGGNPGNPTEDGLALDVRAAYRYLVEELGVAPENLLYFGESLGAGVVSELATEHPPAGLFLRSPFPDLATVAQRHYPFVPARWMLRDRYPVTERLTTVDVPTTVFYGTSDSIIAPESSIEVAMAAAGPVEEVALQDAEHNDPAMFHGRELVDAVLDLAERAVPRR
ncbi:alpha/beta hydrolase [Actinobacteria bacterium YIM 96077]|uniref:Alpha/beta hydrolase n=1 Tax=Phytoactinopolyspora halophila TaxID=1981511 RepID=A0A329R203_9ACTN|nr:alpha/beta hydrolase [Phytoactinopolyspora halophila]AYY12168.1 alpha/beta hydrolase [Actinobacteria bacterium YIM 96077]RAW18597.1 alpha/beta hydrolase [Phytoactinopolyspora halophila]